MLGIQNGPANGSTALLKIRAIGTKTTEVAGRKTPRRIKNRQGIRMRYFSKPDKIDEPDC